MSFTPLGDTLKKNLQDKKGMKDQLEGSEVLEAAQSVFVARFGESQSIHLKPLFLKNRTLTVTCSSSEIAQEIRLNQADIVEEINQELGEKQVDRIRYLA